MKRLQALINGNDVRRGGKGIDRGKALWMIGVGQCVTAASYSLFPPILSILSSGPILGAEHVSFDLWGE